MDTGVAPLVDHSDFVHRIEGGGQHGNSHGKKCARDVAGRSVFASALAVPALAASDTTAERLLNAAAEPENWLTHHKDYAATRYSTLDEIKRRTQDLKVAWTFALGGIEGGGIWPHGGLEGTPIVEDGFMYVTDGGVGL